MSFFRNILFLAALAVTTAGCTAVAKQNIVSTFDAPQASYINRTGTGSIEGQAFLRKVNGDVVTAAGREVALFPDTPFFREVISKMIQGIPFDGADVDISPYSKQTIADADGRFTFSNIAAGKYIVATTVTWGVPTKYGINQEGGHISADATVGSGVTKVLITR